MECSQQETRVAAARTLYENFLEEKCESDLLIPDYSPAAEKIIQCSAVPVILKKDSGASGKLSPENAVSGNSVKVEKNGQK